MANTPRHALPLMSAATEQNWATYSAAMKVIDAKLNSYVQAWQSAPPGSPTEGHTYIVLATGTGAWAGQDNNLAYYINAGWLFYAPTPGQIAWNVATSSFMRWSGSAWEPTLGTYTFGFYFPGQPAANELVSIIIFADTMFLADDFAGSVGYIKDSPTASFVLDVQKNGTSIGSITISTGGVFTFATTGGAVSLVSGDRLSIHAPNPADATAGTIAVTFKGTK